MPTINLFDPSVFASVEERLPLSLLDNGDEFNALSDDDKNTFAALYAIDFYNKYKQKENNNDISFRDYVLSGNFGLDFGDEQINKQGVLNLIHEITGYGTQEEVKQRHLANYLNRFPGINKIPQQRTQSLPRTTVHNEDFSPYKSFTNNDWYKAGITATSAMEKGNDFLKMNRMLDLTGLDDKQQKEMSDTQLKMNDAGRIVDLAGSIGSGISSLLNTRKPSDIYRNIGLYNAAGGPLYAYGGNLHDAGDTVSNGGGNWFSKATNWIGKNAKPLGAMAGLIGQGFQNAQLDVDPNDVRAKVMNKMLGPSGIEYSYDGLQRDMATYTPLNMTTARDFRNKSVAQDIFSAVSSAGQGVAAGSQFGAAGGNLTPHPEGNQYFLGGLIGGAIGGLSSAIGSLFGRSKARKQSRLTNELIGNVNEFNEESQDNRLANIDSNMYGLKEMAALSPYTSNTRYPTSFAYGGDLGSALDYELKNRRLINSERRAREKDKLPGLLSPFGNRFALGGNMHIYGGFAQDPLGTLSTQGSDWTNGVRMINAGGTHEENIHDGVQQGIGSNGKPELVEEGEVVFNDYVYSNRMFVPEEICSLLGIEPRKKGKGKKRNNSGITYADAAKKVQKESAERPNDPISRRGLEQGMELLAQSQEMQREEENQREQAMMNDILAQQAMQPGMRGAYGASGLQAMQGIPDLGISPMLSAYGGYLHSYGGNLHVDGDGLDNKDTDEKKENRAARRKIELIEALGYPFWEDGGLSPLALDIASGVLAKGDFENTFKGFLGNKDFISNNDFINAENKFNWLLENNPEAAKFALQQWKKLADFDGLPITGMLPDEVEAKILASAYKDGDTLKFRDLDNIAKLHKAGLTHINELYDTEGNIRTILDDGTLSPLDVKKDKLDKKAAEEEQWRKNSLRSTYAEDFPTLMNAALFGSSLLGLINKPDYTAANRLVGATKDLLTPVSAPAIGNRISPMVTDQEQGKNTYRALMGAGQRVQANNSGFNRGTLNALMALSDYSTTSGIADIIAKSALADQQSKMATFEGNRGTDIQNANWAMQAASANAAQRANALDRLTQAIALEQGEKTAADNRISLAGTNFAESVKDKSRTNAYINMINTNPAFAYGIGKNYGLRFWGNDNENNPPTYIVQAAFGGPLTYKKKRR